jgi:hypothetical protein
MLLAVNKVRLNLDVAPTVTINLVHIFWGDTDNAALLNYLWVLSYDSLYDLEIFHGNLPIFSTS